MILEMAYYGDPILRKKSQAVAEINDEIRQFVADLIDTLHSHKTGVGLAAPQVHRSLSIFITEVPQPGPENKLIPGPLRIFINPKSWK